MEKNVTKQLRLAGKQYVTTSGKLRNERAVQSQDCTKCRISVLSKSQKKKELKCFLVIGNYRTITDRKISYVAL